MFGAGVRLPIDPGHHPQAGAFEEGHLDGGIEVPKGQCDIEAPPFGEGPGPAYRHVGITGMEGDEGMPARRERAGEFPISGGPLVSVQVNHRVEADDSGEDARANRQSRHIGGAER